MNINKKIVEVTFQESYPYNEGIYACYLNEQKAVYNGSLEIPLMLQDIAIGAVEKIDLQVSANKERMIVTYYGWVWVNNLKAYINVDGVHECFSSIVIDKEEVNGADGEV